MIDISIKSLVIIVTSMFFIRCSDKEEVTPKKVDLILAEDSIALKVGATKLIKITSGSGSYDVEPSTKVTVEFNKNTISVTGVEFGATILRIIDTKTKNSKEVKVEVGVKPYKFEDIAFVKGGTFKMGSKVKGEDALPIHNVTVNDFYISKYEVTNAQFVAFLNEVGNKEEGEKSKAKWYGSSWQKLVITEKDGKFVVEAGKENFPIANLTWYGAKAYAQWIGGRLPSESEWEFAAKGGNKTNGYKFSGNNDSSIVSHIGNYDAGVIGVGKKEPNELGMYDMTGNVAEFCQDKWNKTYKDAPNDGTALNVGGKDKNGDLYYTKRGGHYYADPEQATVTSRSGVSEDSRSGSIGFRVVFNK